MSRARLLLAALTFLLAPALAAQPASESLERDARAAARAGNFKEAAVKFEQAATAASEPKKRGRLRMQAAYATLNAGNTKGARETLATAFADDPGLEIVEQLYTPEFRNLWQDVKEEVARRTPPPLADLAELKRMADEKLKDGRFAEVIYDLGNYPQEKLDREAWAILAQACEKTGRVEQAALARRRALGEAVPVPVVAAPPSAAPPAGGAAVPVTPGLPGASATPTDLLAFGREAFNRGDALTAQAAANRVIEVEPTSSEGYRLLGDSYGLRGEKALAEAMWKQSLRLNERNEGTLVALAELSAGTKAFGEALAYLRTAVAVNPENSDRLAALGRRARAEGDVKAALEIFSAAAEARPQDVAVLMALGATLYQTGDVERALDPLTRAAGTAPDNALVRASLAAAFRRKGSFREAEREYREALRSDPSHLPALQGLGTLLMATGRPAEAVEPYRAALAANGSDAQARLGFARAQRLSGDLDAAATTLKDAAAGSDAALLNEAGAVAYARGAWTEAAALFAKALAANPGMKEAAANRDKAVAAGRLVADLAAPPPAAVKPLTR